MQEGQDYTSVMMIVVKVTIKNIHVSLTQLMFVVEYELYHKLYISN